MIGWVTTGIEFVRPAVAVGDLADEVMADLEAALDGAGARLVDVLETHRVRGHSRPARTRPPAPWSA